MSYIHNDPADFADESAEGFVAAHADTVRRVDGGVARTGRTAAGQVAVVVGGGSGHYPAFAGLVGAGLAHGAVMGNVFASPSAQQVRSVVAAVEAGAGVVLSYGNYAGDALNFDEAQRQLRAAGVACETVRVTDDIFSAPAADRAKRRGIAGDFTVFRALGWAAEQGWDLAAVAAFGERANERTRSMGVAFSGCTLPGATDPLFTVEPGMMAIGMGIHGEPGIRTVPSVSARELAALLVDGLLAEAPDLPSDAPGRVGVIVNGLGSVKGEELYLLFREVTPLLRAAGFEIVQPEVGEYATSFEMAGVSLTLLWLDDELERAWTSPAAAPGYRHGAVRATTAAATESPAAAVAEPHPQPTASPESAAAALVARAAIAAIAAVIDEQVDELGRLDAIAGDGDHGIGMQRGARAAAEAAEASASAGAGLGTLLASAGSAWAHRAGGTSGALWGAGLEAVGESLGDQGAPSAADVAVAVDAGRERIQQMGKAQPGDKTLVDALVPFTETLLLHTARGVDLDRSWRAAAAEAESAAAATAELLPVVGRARIHEKSSLGTPDPGAVSFAFAVGAIAAVLASTLDTDQETES